MVPSNPNGNGENSTGMMGIPNDAPQNTAASSGKFYDLFADQKAYTNISVTGTMIKKCVCDCI